MLKNASGIKTRHLHMRRYQVKNIQLTRAEVEILSLEKINFIGENVPINLRGMAAIPQAT